MSKPRWKAFVGGKKLGPVDDDTLREWIAEGKVSDSTQIWRPGMPKWLKAKDVEEVALFFEATVAIATPDFEAEAAAAQAEAEAKAQAEAQAQAEEAERAAAEAARQAEEEARAKAEEEARRAETAAAEAAAMAAQQSVAPLMDAEAAGIYDDDDSPTVIQASPFVDVDKPQDAAAAAVTPSRPERPESGAAQQSVAPVDLDETVDARTVPESIMQQQATAQEPRRSGKKPPLPLLPILLSLLALIPTALLVVGIVAGSEFEGQALLVRGLWIATVAGLGIMMILPLTYSKLGLLSGILGSFIALASWLAFVVYMLAAVDWDVSSYLSGTFLSFDTQLGLISAIIHWSALLVPLFGFIYYATTGKYRRRVAR